MIEVLGKKYVKEIILILGNNEEGIFFTDLIDEIGESSENIHQSAVSRSLNLMLENGLILRDDVFETNRRLPKSFYRLTELGKMALEIMKKDEELEKARRSKFHNEIKGNVGQVINIDKADGLEINFKKK